MADSDIPAEHALHVVVSRRLQGGKEQRLECSDCDLRIIYTISPAKSAEHFAWALQKAHTRQIQEANRG
jgi:hypothetical protein